MTDGASVPRPAFVVHDYFLETAFELRFQGLLRQAWRERSWHVIAALPGSGKSLGIADMTLKPQWVQRQQESHSFPAPG
jgi:hypothetical protein